MTSGEIRRRCVQCIREECASAGVAVTRIVLFGSQARNTADSGSDWDFLVCTTGDIPFPSRAAITTRVQRTMASEGVSVDIVMKSEASLERERNNVGVLSYYALRDGVPA
jgi:predicted nucleotidyltransferase